MEGLSTVFLKDILIESKDGEWGKEHFDPDYIKMFVIRGTDFSSVRYGNIDKVPCRYIRKNIAIRKKLQCDDILIETAGGTKDQPTGRSLFLKKHILDREIDFICASFSRFLRIDPQRAFPEFIFWYLQYLYTYGYMYPYHVQHTGVARFQYTQFASQMIFQLPSYVEQQGIAHILGTLDDKIELNRRQNATLEAMAQAIFKDWFVDFGPVRAKKEGRQPEGMSREIADLFPDRLDGEGKPEGWEWKTLDSILELCYGKALKASERIPGKTPVYGSGGITGYHNQALVITPSIIVGRKGTIGSLYIEHRPFYPIDTVFYVKSDYSIFFCYFILKQQKLKDMNTDAAVPGLNRNNVYRLVFSMPSNIVIEKFDAYIQNIYKKIYHNYSEISILISLRDTLLPKLISGELRVPDAEKMVADIV